MGDGQLHADLQCLDEEGKVGDGVEGRGLLDERGGQRGDEEEEGIHLQ